MNEKAVGRASKKSGVDRKEIFLETKLWPSFYEQADAVEKTLERLDTDYIDLLLIHQPAGNVVIPGSKNPDHIRANFDLFDFSLSDAEMAEITALNQNKRYHTSTPEKLKAYVEMVPSVDEQK